MRAFYCQDGMYPVERRVFYDRRAGLDPAPLGKHSAAKLAVI